MQAALSNKAVPVALIEVITKGAEKKTEIKHENPYRNSDFSAAVEGMCACGGEGWGDGWYQDRWKDCCPSRAAMSSFCLIISMLE